jgi:hypothetical protein
MIEGLAKSRIHNDMACISQILKTFKNSRRISSPIHARLRLMSESIVLWERKIESLHFNQRAFLHVLDIELAAFADDDTAASTLSLYLGTTFTLLSTAKSSRIWTTQ